MNELTVFNFNQSQVRTVIDSDGTPLFCGKDVCDILGYTNANKAMGDHCKGVTKRYPLQTAGGMQEARFLTEPDLYRLIVSSQLPAAQEFEKWVFEEVLPTIRKTGQYKTVTTDMTSEEFTSRTFAAFKSIAITAGLEGNAAIVSADNAMKRLHNVSPLKLLQIELKNPDQQYLLTPTQIAERLKLSGPREVNRLLAAKNFQVKEAKCWIPTQKGKPFATLLDTGKRHSDGTMIQQLKWRESVLDELRTLTELDD